MSLEVAPMASTVTRRGRVEIPAEIMERHGICPGDRLAWVDDGTSIRVIPMLADPIAALRGRGQGERLVERLLQDRRV